MKGIMNHFFPTKALQHQKSYLHQVFFNTQDPNICKFILCINNIGD